MENASKALIIAAAVLVTILVISLGVYVFNYYSDKVKSQSNMDTEEIAAFNNQILEYLGDNVSGSQVNALIQTVYSINQSAITESPTAPYPTISITFPDADGNNVTLAVTGSSEGGYSNSYTGSSRRVETAGKTYKVVEDYEDGYISKITVTQN